LLQLCVCISTYVQLLNVIVTCETPTFFQISFILQTAIKVVNKASKKTIGDRRKYKLNNRKKYEIKN